MKILILLFCILLTVSYGFAKDIEISVTDINFPDKIYLNKKATIYIVLTNSSDTDVQGCMFNVEADDGAKVNQSINLPKSSSQRVEIKWVPQRAGKMNFKVTVTAPKDSKDTNETNNQVTKEIEVLTR